MQSDGQRNLKRSIKKKYGWIYEDEIEEVSLIRFCQLFNESATT